MTHKQAHEAAVVKAKAKFTRIMLAETRQAHRPVCDVSAAITAYLSAMEQAGFVVAPVDAWQPIATAPKDGTSVLLIGRYPDGKSWSDIYHCWWSSRMWQRWPHRVGSVDPTHWQPLPAPPKPNDG